MKGNITMAKYNKKISDTNIRLGEVRFSFAHVFEPRKQDDGTEKYGVCVLIPKKDKETVELFKSAYEAAKQAGKSSKWDGKIPAKVVLPLHDGDEERADDENFEGMWFFNANAKNAPGIRVKDGGTISEAIDEDDFYSGCWGAVTVNLFPYKSSGNVGVGVGLNNVIKTRDDTKLAGSRSADADFADMED